MRKWWVIATVAAMAVTTAAFAGALPAGAKAANPVSLDGKVNAKGTKDISSKSTAKLSLEADDYYFSPTFVKVAPGEKVTIEVENEGKAAHTFTSDALHIDQQVQPGKSKKFTVTVPNDGTAFQFHCNFHESMGMQGAFYTQAGTTTKTSTTVTPTGTSNMGSSSTVVGY
jgi:plastocyanin